jgi:DNA polymerase epsilon subunit 1
MDTNQSKRLKLSPAEMLEERIRINEYKEELDTRLGFAKLARDDTTTRLGWLFNVQPTSVIDKKLKSTRSAVDFYFICEDGSGFKCTKCYDPYFFVQTKVVVHIST